MHGKLIKLVKNAVRMLFTLFPCVRKLAEFADSNGCVEQVPEVALACP